MASLTELSNLYTVKKACQEIVDNMNNVVAPFLFNGMILPDADEYVQRCNQKRIEFFGYCERIEEELTNGIREYCKK